MSAIGKASPLAVSARRFGLALDNAVERSGMTGVQVARALGINRSRIANWKSGTSLPSQELAERLADVLCEPRLAKLVSDARRRPCDNCGKPFIAAEASPARYCSVACRRNMVKQVEGRRDLSRAVLQRRVALLDRAIASMCAECEPSGLCQTPTCPLQIAGVSPQRVAVAS